jgi:predicted O-methyltransferase YrrM
VPVVRLNRHYSAITASARALTRETLAVRRLPARVALLYLRCVGVALARRDRWSLRAATRPNELAHLIDLARGRSTVVELGTGTAWTALALAVSDEHRRVVTYDPKPKPHRPRYLALANGATRRRIELVEASGEDGPPSRDARVDLVFIDSVHSQEATAASFRAWEPALADGGLAVFHDYGPAFPGVMAAVAELALEGDVLGNLFVWEKPAAA